MLFSDLPGPCALWQRCSIYFLLLATSSSFSAAQASPPPSTLTAPLPTPSISVNSRVNKTGGSREICLIDNPPLAYCEGLDEGNYSGYSVGLWREIMEYMGVDRTQWHFKCSESRDLILVDLLDASGTCWAVVGGMPVDDIYLKHGIQYSYPTYKQGMKILIDSEMKSDTWSIFRPFSLGVWLAVMGTSILAGLIIWLFEEASVYGAPQDSQDMGSEPLQPHQNPDKAPKKAPMWKRIRRSVRGVQTEGLKDTVWETTGNVIGIACSAPRCLSSRLVLFAYGFMILIMVALYTAAVTADVTATQLNNKISGYEDLHGRRVAASADYALRLEKLFDVKALVIPWDTNKDLVNAVESLERGDVDAIVGPTTWITYWDAQKCNLFAVGDSTATYDIAFAFPPDSSTAEVEYVSEGLLQLQREEAVMDRLQDTFINLNSDCPSPDPDGAFQVNWEMVAGLWFITCISFGFGLLLLLVPVVLNLIAKRPIFAGN